MRENEFQKQYHNYMASSLIDAQEEAIKVNDVAEGFTVEPQHFPGLGFCLMLSTAKSFINELCPELKEEKN